MPHYDDAYDYGHRGYRHRGYDHRDYGEARRRIAAPQPRGEEDAFFTDRDERRTGPRAPRVTSRYNRDYVYGARGEDAYLRNYSPYAGDRRGRILGTWGYRHPYVTIGGTRTTRGSTDPIRYDRVYDDDLEPRRFR